MNKTDLARLIAPHVGGHTAATTAIDAITDAIIRQVTAGRAVHLTGFGTFETAERKDRTGRNPHTGESVLIESTTVPRFRPGTAFKAYVAGHEDLPVGLAGRRKSATVRDGDGQGRVS